MRTPPFQVLRIGALADLNFTAFPRVIKVQPRRHR